MDIPFHGMTEEEKAEVTVYIQNFIDRAATDGVIVTPISAYNLSEEMFALNYSKPSSEFLQWKWIYRGEEGRRKWEERARREWDEDNED